MAFKQNNDGVYLHVDDLIPQDMLEIMADMYCRKILNSTINSPKSAMEIATEHDIPLTSVYRKLRFLVKIKAMRISGGTISNGRRVFLYQHNMAEPDYNSHLAKEC